MKKLIRNITALILALIFMLAAAITVFAASVKYTVTFAQVENAKWNNSNPYSITANTGYINRTIKPVSSDYYVESVFVDTEKSDGTADLTFYSNTGNVLIENVTGNITLDAVVKKKINPTALTVSYSFKEGGVYSESNPAVQVTFNVTAADNDGDICPDVTIYFKSDSTEKSFTSRITDENGIASFTYSYGIEIEAGHTSEDFTAQFALENDSTKILAEQDIHIVQQFKKDLVLYTYQVQAASPNGNDGKVTGITDTRYEYFTGELHQGAIVTDSGQWESPVNGEITGLSPGQYALRFKEYADYSTNTFYLHSNYDYFTIERGEWSITADIENSNNVTFSQQSQKVYPGATAYFYITVDEGYEIISYSVDKANYISGIDYDEENGIIIIDGVTGSVILTVHAEKKETPAVTAPNEETTDAENVSKTEDAAQETTLPTTDDNPAEIVQEGSTAVLTAEESTENNTQTNTNKAASTNNKSPNTGCDNYALSAAFCLAGISALAITLRKKRSANQ